MEFWEIFWLYTLAGTIIFSGLTICLEAFGSLLQPFLFLFILGLSDYLQKKRAVLEIFHLWEGFDLFEAIRPDYVNTFGKRTVMSCRIQKSKSAWFITALQILARPFGSDENHYLEDFSWLNHSIFF